LLDFAQSGSDLS